MLTVAAAEPILALEAGHAAIRPAACQIALPNDHDRLADVSPSAGRRR